jgi:putative membrane protein
MILGFAVSIFIVGYLLAYYRTPTLIFFVGIIVGFLPFLWKETLQQANHRLQAKHYVIMLLFISLIVFSPFLGAMNNINVDNLSVFDYIFFTAAGFIASTALVLPGISGALILTILGVYETATASLLAFNFPVIAAIGSGMIAGILLTSKLIRYLLTRYPSETYAAMMGLVSASIYAIFFNLDPIAGFSSLAFSAVTFLAGIAFINTLMQKSKM